MPVPPDWSQKLTAFVDDWKRRSQNRKSPGEEYLGDEPFDRFVLTEQAESWDHFLRWLQELQGFWCFRGQREACWLLHTSLDRGVEREHSSQNSSSYYHLNRETEGRDLLFRFQQHAHSYLRHTPSVNDLSSWFALMQHHCVPTRLLDWTESPYVAMYFALEERAKEKRPAEKESHSAVWAIDLAWLEAKGHELLQSENSSQSAADSSQSKAEYINGLLRETEKPVIIRIDPVMSNARMFAQRGIFLCNLRHEASFGQILMSMMIHPETTDRPVIRKVEVESSLRVEFLKHLRAMNVHRASLFPGLDGLGVSLKLDLELKDSVE